MFSNIARFAALALVAFGVAACGHTETRGPSAALVTATPAPAMAAAPAAANPTGLKRPGMAPELVRVTPPEPRVCGDSAPTTVGNATITVAPCPDGATWTLAPETGRVIAKGLALGVMGELGSRGRCLAVKQVEQTSAGLRVRPDLGALRVGGQFYYGPLRDPSQRIVLVEGEPGACEGLEGPRYTVTGIDAFVASLR